MPSLPKYACHKTVRAARIVKMVEDQPHIDSSTLHFEEDLGSTNVSREWVREKKAVEGGYFIVYEDGYTSFSPAAAFESGYEKIEG